MLRIISIALAFTIVIGVAVIVMGYTTSPVYSDKTSFIAPYPRNFVWNELVNIKDSHIKKEDVESVEVIEQLGKLLAWQENLKNGGYRIYRMNERVEDKKLVVELVESSYELTGIWTFELYDHEQGSEIVIIEESELVDYKLRGVRYFFGRNHDLLVWTKYIKVGLTERLIRTL